MTPISLKQRLICLLALLLFAGMALAQTAADAGKDLPMRRGPEMTPLVNTDIPGYFVIRDQAKTVPGKTTAVDFNKEMLLAVVMGSGESTKLSGTITGVREFTDRLLVTVNETVDERPELKIVEGVLVHLAALHDVVAVPKSDKPVYFEISKPVITILTSTVYPIFHQFSGQQSRVDKSEIRVIKDVQEWKSLWKDSIGSAPPTLDIDFTRQMALAIFLGQQGGSVDVNQLMVSDDGKALTVSYHPQQQPVNVATTPYFVLVIPTSNLPVFVREKAPELRQTGG